MRSLEFPRARQSESSPSTRHPEQPEWLPKIDTIIFDVDGTLYWPDEPFQTSVINSRYQVLARHLGVSLEEIEASYPILLGQYGHSHTRAIRDGLGLNPDEIWEEVYNKVGFSAYLEHHTRCHLPDRLARLMEELIEADYNLGVLTNDSWPRTTKKLESLRLPPWLFTGIVCTYDPGVPEKPNLRAFELALEETGGEPEKTLFVGDNLGIDIRPAGEVGMKTCLVGNYPGADICLRNVLSLPDILLGRSSFRRIIQRERVVWVRGFLVEERQDTA